MFIVKKATSADFDRVYPLFQTFAGTPIPKEIWKKIFVTPWTTTKDFCGYLLENDGDIKGYLGAISSQRIINNKPEKFCNMTSWIVADDSRSQSIFMLLELLKLEDYTLTNFTASPTVATILGKLGFKDFRMHQRVLLPVPDVPLRKHGQECYFDLHVVQSKLDDTQLRIFEDHQGLNCDHLLLRSGKGNCYVVLKRTERRYIPFTKVHYLSNIDVFNECIERFIVRICLQLRVLGMLVDERYIEGHHFRNSLKYPHQRKAFFKSNSIVDSNSIDTLYSELVILHH